MKLRVLTLVAILCLTNVYPCGWDWDTIKMEKQKFPSIHELITGKFLRHSNEFYYWRVKSREKLMRDNPDSLNYYDDLGWALDKLGRHEEAINTFLKKEDLKPGLYETYANLGTSYIHNKQFDKGLVYIKKAIEINPEAHFGREVYQQKLVEYIIEKSDSNGKFSLPLGTTGNNFYHFLYRNHMSEKITEGSSHSKELAKAIKGVAGMMRFGSHDSPILLEAIGDLLTKSKTGEYKGAGHLASRAYIKAGIEVKNDKIRKKYEKKAVAAAEQKYAGHIRQRPGQENRHVEYHAFLDAKLITTMVKYESEKANIWFDSLRVKEIQWIKAGIDVDSAYDANYYKPQKIKHLSDNGAWAKKDKLNEEYWLAYQLDTSNLKKLEVHDSIVAFLDSVYKEEPKTPEIDSTTVSKTPKAGEPQVSKKTAYIAFAVAIIATIVFFVGRRIQSRRR